MSTDFTYDFSYSRRQSSEQSDGVARADSSTDFAEGRKHSSSEYSYENGWGSGSTSGHRHGGGGGGGGGRSWRGGYSGGRHGGGGGGGKGGGRSGGHGGKGGRGGRKGGGGKGAHHSKYSKHFTYDEKVYLLLNKISKGPVGWRNELDVFGKGRWDHKNCSIFVAAESQGDADAAGMLLQEQAKHAEAIVQHPTLETRVATSHDVRVQLGHGFDVRKVVWQRADSATVHFTLPVLDVRPIRFQRVESPRMINASLTALLGVYGQVLQEKVPADLGLSEKVKAQLACVMCVQEFLGVHQIMRVDMVEVRKVLSAAQELLLSPDSKLPRPAGFLCSTKNVKYDKTNFRVLTTAGDGEESAPVEADCGVFVDGTLVLPAGATIVRKSRDDGNGGTEAVWVVVKPACEFEAADGCASTGFKLMQALYKQGCSHYRATRDVSKGVYTGRIHMASSEEAEKFVGIDTFVGPYKLVKSMVPPDVTKEGLDLPISMSFVQVKRLHSYFEERVEELQKLIASDRQVQVKLEAGMGQYMIRVKGSNAATVEEIGEYIREFIIKGVVISTAEESRLEEVGFDYTKMVTLRMKSRSVNAIEKRLRLNDEPCAVAVAGNGNETITYVTGRGAQTVAEEIRKIIHDRQTRVALQTSEPMEDVHRVAKKYGCKVNGNAVGSSSLVGLAEDIVVAEAELKKVYDVECAICRCEETAYTSSCAEKHTICRVCIEDWIVHAMQNNDFPLRCPGCLDKTPMLLHDVQQMLTITSKTVEDLVRPALRAYMSAHHDEVRCCSTVDCSGVVPQGKGMYACVECTRMQCTTCNNENHWDATLTCEEAKEMNLSEGDKKTRDVIDSLKACPRCKLKVEKSTGCNAVRCVCGAGFCWLCGEDCGTDAEAHHHFGKQGTPCYAKLFEGVYSNDAE